MTIIIIGGGAAGFFGAIRAAESNPDAKVFILERGKEVLGKVKVSGGGRCNLTHACFAPMDLVKYYPRGSKELLGPFNTFAPADTVEWFEQRGVKTKTEQDGRMFPVTNKSQTIIDCLLSQAQRAGIEILYNQRVWEISPPGVHSGKWCVQSTDNRYEADKVLIAAGSSQAIWDMLEKLGISIVEPVPSLFTFNIQDQRIQELPGVSVPMAQVQVVGTRLESSGPVLITHWGLSGPAVLKLSAWGARDLHQLQYRFTIVVNWIMKAVENCKQELMENKESCPRRQVVGQPLYSLPSRLWNSLVLASGIGTEKRWADVGKKEMHALAEQLTSGKYSVSGKSTFKEEFVTAGGVDLKEVNFKTFESKKFPGLYFAGEVLNIDAVTGGFNFQAAWTGGWIAGSAMGQAD